MSIIAIHVFSLLNQKINARLKYAFTNGGIDMKHKIGTKESLFFILLS